MRVGIATDHGGFGLKEELGGHLRAAGHEVVDFGAHNLNPDDDYPDFVIPLAQAVVVGTVERGWPFVAVASERRSAPTRYQEFVPGWCTTTSRPGKELKTTT
jgi:hypothetical protein